jgi:hypothetical protein
LKKGKPGFSIHDFVTTSARSCGAGVSMMDRDGSEIDQVEYVELELPQVNERQPRGKRVHRSLSAVLNEIAERPDDSFTIADVRDALADRSFATLLFLFAAINCLPLPPGSSAFLGLPTLIISAQMIVGQSKVWLPDFILKRPISATRFRQIVERLSPWLRKTERLVRPRFWPFPIMLIDRVIGLIAFFLSILLVAPIPLGNWLPAFSMALFGLALSERDGIVLAAAAAAAIAALGVIVAIFGTAAYAAGMFFHM